MAAESSEQSGKLAVYMRVSTGAQARQGTIENQRSDLQRYCDAHGVAPAGWYEDDGVSGYTYAFAQRPSGARLMADIRAGHVNAVVVTKLDRLGRNTREILNALHEIEQAGARVISLKENIDASTPAGRLFRNQLAAFAEFERDLIAERTADGKERRLTETVWQGGPPPIGYRSEGAKKDARLVKDEEPDDSGYSEGDVVRLAWHLLLEEDWTIEKIAARLTDLHIPTRAKRRGLTHRQYNGVSQPLTGAWVPPTVWRMLTNPVHKGQPTYMAPDGQVITRDEPQLAYVSEQDWERGQAILRQRSRSGRRTTGRVPLLADLVYCAHCGKPYVAHVVAKRTKDTVHRYYTCSGRRYRNLHNKRRRQYGQPLDTSPVCAGGSISAPWLEDAVWQDIEGYARDPGAVLVQLAAQIGSEAQAESSQRKTLAELDKDAEQLQAQRDNAISLHLKGRITGRDLDRQLDDLDREGAELQKKRATAQAALEDTSDRAAHLNNARTLLQRLHVKLGSAPLSEAEKREQIEALVLRVTVYQDPDGVSQRGRAKRRARVRIAYAFDDPSETQSAVANVCDTFKMHRQMI